MVKICSNCSTEMVGGFKVKLDNSPLANFVVCKKSEKMKICACVCPNCGKVDFYVCNSLQKREG